MPKLITDASRRGATLMASATGNRYQIDENGAVDVDQRDVADLLKAGFALEGEKVAEPEAKVSTFSQDAAQPAEKPADAPVTGAAAGTAE